MRVAPRVAFVRGGEREVGTRKEALLRVGLYGWGIPVVKGRLLCGADGDPARERRGRREGRSEGKPRQGEREGE